jgi:hypothetical protein
MGHVECYGREVHKRFWRGNLKEKKPLGWPRHRWKDNSKIDLQGVRWKGMHWIDLPQDSDRWWALVNVVMNLQVP